jgi:5-methylthioadenosine/S-adenosylhomocysteine deaminase
MSQLLLKSVWLENERRDIRIADGVFKTIAPAGTLTADVPDVYELDCRHMAIVPAFYNTHTHAAMTFVRGLADDVPLKVWLEQHIWPREAKLSDEDVYVASKKGEAKQLMIPALKAVVKEINIKEGRMVVDMPEEI